MVIGAARLYLFQCGARELPGRVLCRVVAPRSPGACSLRVWVDPEFGSQGDAQRPPPPVRVAWPACMLPRWGCARPPPRCGVGGPQSACRACAGSSAPLGVLVRVRSSAGEPECCPGGAPLRVCCGTGAPGAVGGAVSLGQQWPQGDVRGGVPCLPLYGCGSRIPHSTPARAAALEPGGVAVLAWRGRVVSSAVLWRWGSSIG